MNSRIPKSGERLVILGGGPAGLAAARRAAKGAPEAEVVLVNRSSQQTNIPALPAYLATGKNVQADLEEIARTDGFELVVDEAVRVDDHEVELASGRVLPFEAMVVATGAVTSKFLPTAHTARLMPDVQKLREELLSRLANASAPVRVTIVGAGLSGIEYAAALAEAHPGRVEVTLIGETIALPNAKDIPYTRERLRDLGVRVYEGVLVKGLEQDGLAYGKGDSVWHQKADLVLLVAGERGAAEGLTSLPVDRQGHLETRSTLQTGRDWIFAAGDAASIEDAKTGKPVARTVKMAEDTGRMAAENWLRWRKGKSLERFHGSTPGWIASLGTQDGVGRIGPVSVKGTVASSFKETLLDMQSHPAEISDGWKKYLQMVKWFRFSG